MNKVFFLSFIKSLLILLLILFGLIHLSPDEAQYWTWSRHLDWGYYSKPAGIAYQIAFGTSLFGPTELGVRFGSLLIGFIMPFLIYKLARVATLNEDESFWAAFVWCLMPIGIMGSLFAITDVGMILFWTAALYFLLKEGVEIKFAVAIALGALFKFPIYLLWPIAFFYERISKKWLKPFLISLLGLIPTLIWNLLNGFVTFRHVGATLPGGTSAVQSSGNFLSFVGSQIALISPVFIVLLILGFLYTRRRDIPRQVLFLGFISLTIIAIGSLVSLFTKVQGNWIDFAYPGMAPFIAYVAFRFYKGKRWLVIGGAISACLIVATLFLPYKMSPYKHNKGWDRLDWALKQAGYDPDEQFLFADSYQTTALLSFYTTEQKQAYFFNLNHIRNNQYSIWPSMPQNELKKDGLFVLIDDGKADYNHIVKTLSPYFNAVSYKGTYPIIDKKRAIVVEGYGYNGQLPFQPDLY